MAPVSMEFPLCFDLMEAVGSKVEKIRADVVKVAENRTNCMVELQGIMWRSWQNWEEECHDGEMDWGLSVEPWVIFEQIPEGCPEGLDPQLGWFQDWNQNFKGLGTTWGPGIATTNATGYEEDDPWEVEQCGRVE
tara:strand:+ start:2415 stop:2819 length:405 start_codon:yes stop_codon:yes gene_type:complete